MMKATEMMAQEIERTEAHYITFEIGGELYGLDTMYVHEIFRTLETEPAPDSCVFLRGRAHMRGRDVPVIDLRTLLGRPDDDGPETCIVFTEYNGAGAGLVVDNICEVISVSLKDVEVSRGREPWSNYLYGIVNTLYDQKVRLINLYKLLFIEEREMVSQ